MRAQIASAVLTSSAALHGAALTLESLDDVGIPGGVPGAVISGVPTVDGQLGFSLASGNDLDGDGVDDLVIGDKNKGRVYVVYGGLGAGPSGTLTTADIGSTLPGSTLTASPSFGSSFERLGTSVNIGGDFNNDGFVDLSISANGSGVVPGGSFLVYGNGQSLPMTLDLADLNNPGQPRGLVVTKPSGGQGFDVSIIPDVNGDSFDDFALAHGKASNSLTQSDLTTQVIFGKPDQNNQPVVVGHVDTTEIGAADGVEGIGFYGNTIFDTERSGLLRRPGSWSVGGAGDVNGDGVNDLVIGDTYKHHDVSLLEPPFNDPEASQSPDEPGSAYVVYGGSHLVNGTTVDLDNVGVPSDPNAPPQGFELVASWDHIGLSGVTTGRDWNGDGIDDVLVSEGGATVDGYEQTGSGYLIFGVADDPDTPDIEAVPTQILARDVGVSAGFDAIRFAGGEEEGRFGWSSQEVGDINGDGFNDLVFTSPQRGNFSGDAIGGGYVTIVYGQEVVQSGVVSEGDLETPGSAPYDAARYSGSEFGAAAGYAAAAGDLNGDGLSDVIVGAPLAGVTTPEGNTGAVYIIYGERDDRVTWIDRGADQDWETAFNWLGHALPDSASNVELFSDAALDINGPNTGTTVNSLAIGGGGGVTTLRLRGSGILTATNGVTIAENGVLSNATPTTIGVVGDLSNGGRFALSGDAARSPALITADYTQLSGGELSLDVLGVGPSDHDRINVLGNVVLSGHLDLVAASGLANAAAYGDEVELLTGSSVSGTFETVDGALLEPTGSGPEKALAVKYESGRVYARVSMYGDANTNGTIEQGDLDPVLQRWGESLDANGNPVTWATGDYDGSGDIQQGDMDAVLQNWGNVEPGSQPPAGRAPDDLGLDLVINTVTGEVSVEGDGNVVSVILSSGDGSLVGSADENVVTWFDDHTALMESAKAAVFVDVYGASAAVEDGGLSLGRLVDAGTDLSRLTFTYALDTSFDLLPTSGDALATPGSAAGGLAWGRGDIRLVPEPGVAALAMVGGLMSGLRGRGRRSIAA